MDFPFIKGSLEFVGILKQNGVKVAIVTSSDDKKMKNVYRIYPQLKTLFDAIITADRITRSKPDPECYLKAMGLLGAVPQECLVFEDSSVGIHAAKQAGIEVAAFTGSGNGQDVSEADYVVSSYEESKRVLI